MQFVNIFKCLFQIENFNIGFLYHLTSMVFMLVTWNKHLALVWLWFMKQKQKNQWLKNMIWFWVNSNPRKLSVGAPGLSTFLLLEFVRPGGGFKNTYELLNLRALKFSLVNKIHIFQCMGMIFCVEFQRYPLKFHSKYLTHTLEDMSFIQHWNFKSS